MTPVFYKITQMALALTFSISLIVMQDRITGARLSGERKFASRKYFVALHYVFVTLARFSYDIF